MRASSWTAELDVISHSMTTILIFGFMCRSSVAVSSRAGFVRAARIIPEAPAVV